jgi:hypothetical protein
MINQKYLNYVALVLMLIVAIWIFRTNDKESWKKVAQTLINNEFHGIVLKKYIDSENHNDPIVILTSKQKINLWNFYDNVEVGDSLSKPKGTSIMEVYRNGKVQKLDFNIEFKKPGERTSH